MELRWVAGLIAFAGCWSVSHAQVAGQVTWTGGEIKFYDGVNWRSTDHGVVAGSCSGDGRISYNSTNTRFEYCASGALHSMQGATMTACGTTGNVVWDAANTTAKYCAGGNWQDVQNKATFVQARGRTQSTSASTMANNAFVSTVTAGNTIACGFFYECTSSTISSVTDTGGNTYSKADNVRYALTGGMAGECAEIWTAPVTTGGSSFVVTMNLTANNTYRVMGCVEYSGVANPVIESGKTVTAGGTGTSATTNIVPTALNGAVFAVVVTLQAASAGSGYTQRVNVDGHSFIDKSFTTAGTTAVNGTISPSAQWGIIATILKSK